MTIPELRLSIPWTDGSRTTRSSMCIPKTTQFWREFGLWKSRKSQERVKKRGIICREKTLTQERIAILEGLLAATENRLLYYIEREKEQA